ncbi:M28 family peptidase [Flammeovirga sp. SubArs3]|uniref:M28 family peptidase n=1 Tax=Flammeovirga sp. SubArs3 TaxID=2995316 RepID=UPI00248CB8F8|nr:M28 family peptidase [Flammeovirga sp. SubArs3]
MLVTFLISLLILFLLVISIGIYTVYMPTFNTKFNQELANTITPDHTLLRKHVEALCSTSEYRNYKNKGAQKEATDYIHTTFEEYGYEVKLQEFEAAGDKYINLIAFYGDPNLPRVVVGAHYDTFGDQHGADDNASGIAGVLEIARLLQLHNPNIDFCVELVAYANEERPFFTTKGMGSYIHAQKNYKDNIDMLLMVCLEMIGYFDDSKNSQSYPISSLNMLYPKEANFIALVGNLDNHNTVKKFKRGLQLTSKVPTYSINAPSSIRGLANSDHRNYWNFKQNALMVTDTSYFRNPHYHLKSDLPETLNFQKMSEVVKGTFFAITEITR